MIRRIIVCIGFIVLYVNILSAQSEKYQITNYSKKEYGRGQEAQNWAVIQDNRGFMYFGNSNGN